jgi:hypothetical protein
MMNLSVFSRVLECLTLRKDSHLQIQLTGDNSSPFRGWRQRVPMFHALNKILRSFKKIPFDLYIEVYYGINL